MPVALENVVEEVEAWGCGAVGAETSLGLNERIQ
jgi:hypothetical protein